ELGGLRELSKPVEPTSDIQNVTAVFGHAGTTFGWNEIGQTPGFVEAERGGILDNDSAQFFHVPVQRRAGPWLTRYRYVFARGTQTEVDGYVARLDHPRLVGQKDDWFLYEQPPLQAGDVEALRSRQGWSTLRANPSLLPAARSSRRGSARTCRRSSACGSCTRGASSRAALASTTKAGRPCTRGSGSATTRDTCSSSRSPSRPGPCTASRCRSRASASCC